LHIESPKSIRKKIPSHSISNPIILPERLYGTLGKSSDPGLYELPKNQILERRMMSGFLTSRCSVSTSCHMIDYSINIDTSKTGNDKSKIFVFNLTERQHYYID
jgi:hypothetical protein